MKIYLKIDDDRVSDVKFETFGCGSAIAASSMATELIKGKKLDEVMDTQASMKGFLDEETDKVCEKCGKPMMKKLGRFGFFLACSGFPECHNTRSIPLAKCPMKDCDGEIVARKTKGRGKEFYGCTKYPDCNFITHFKPIDQYCPECGWFLVEKYDKKNGSYKSCINPDCDYLHSSEDESVAESVE